MLSVADGVGEWDSGALMVELQRRIGEFSFDVDLGLISSFFYWLMEKGEIQILGDSLCFSCSNYKIKR